MERGQPSQHTTGSDSEFSRRHTTQTSTLASPPPLLPPADPSLPWLKDGDDDRLNAVAAVLVLPARARAASVACPPAATAPSSAAPSVEPARIRCATTLRAVAVPRSSASSARSSAVGASRGAPVDEEGALDDAAAPAAAPTYDARRRAEPADALSAVLPPARRGVAVVNVTMRHAPTCGPMSKWRASAASVGGIVAV